MAVLSAFWPMLIAVVVVALRSPNAKRLLAGFYAGALLTTVTVGLVVVHLLQTTSLVTTARDSFDPAVYIAAGLLALAAAYVLQRRPVRTAPPEESEPSWWERLLDRGAAFAFVAGVVLDVFPGVLPFVALKNIAELDYGVGGTTVAIVAFYLVMFTIIEVPLLGFVFAPREAEQRARRFNHWLDRNMRRLAVYALIGAGIYLFVRGVAAR